MKRKMGRMGPKSEIKSKAKGKEKHKKGKRKEKHEGESRQKHPKGTNNIKIFRRKQTDEKK